MNLIEYLGIPLILLGIWGIVKTIKNKKLLHLHVLFGFFVLNFTLTLLTGYSLGFHYVRTFYLGSIIFAVYSAYGLWTIFNFLIKRIKKGVSVLICIFIIVITILPTLVFYFNLSHRLRPSSYVNFWNKDVRAALNYLKGFPDKNRRLLHPLTTSSIITPLSGFKVTSLTPCLIGGKINRYHGIGAYSKCEKIKKIIDEEGYELLFFYKPVNKCSFLKPIFENKSIVIYEYQKDL